MPPMPNKLYSSPSESLWGRLAVWLATGVGVGFVAPAPGTIGGLWGLGLAAAIDKAPNIEVQLAIVALLLLAAVPICHVAALALGAASDPQAIVLDEIVVLPIVFLGGAPLNWRLLIAGFLLFRLFDIWKPGLVRTAEKLPGGWGIVADDAVAAALAWASLRALVWLSAATNLHWLAA
jgi:phosphatidylglycerophosphatase A